MLDSSRETEQQLVQEVARRRAKLAEAEEALEGLRAARRLIAEIARNGNNGKERLRPAVLRLIQGKAGEFTAPELWEELRESDPASFGEVHKASVSSAVKDFADKGEIRLLREGAGRRAAVYANLDSEQKEGGEAVEAESPGSNRGSQTTN